MADSIVQLTAADFDEAMIHLGLVFGDPDFAGLVPSLYSRTDASMACNYAVRRGGRIAGIVGLFPIEWIVGGDRLRLAGIGGVSVNPAYRGQGLMRLLMDAVMAEVGRGGYHAACLGGNRRRYAYWGFEKAGVEASFVVTPNSLTHSLSRKAGEGYRLDIVGPGDLAVAKHLYERSAVRCGRTSEVFAHHLRNWRRTPAAVRDARGMFVGYGCIDPRDGSCVDLSVADTQAIDGFLLQQVLSEGKPLRVNVPVLQTGLFRRLAELSDDTSLIEASNWRVYDWPAVVGALLRVKHSIDGLEPGSCVLRVTDPGANAEAQGFRMTVDGGAKCERTDDEADLDADASQVIRALAGPLPVTPLRPELPGHGCLLKWRPLPLMIPMQDRI